MILADLTTIGRQLPARPLFAKALDFLLRPGIGNLPDGRIELDGERVFAIVQRYETIAGGMPRFEYHRKYIDIQCVVSGEEIIGWAPADRIYVLEPYDEDKDIAFGSVPAGDWTPLLLLPGRAAVLFPDDGHAPKLAVAAPLPVVKIVVKISV